MPTGSRGVVTQFGKIVGIEGEGWPSCRRGRSSPTSASAPRRADIENAEGSTSDTQPVKVSMTVRYSIATDRVAEVFEKYSHDGNLSSYVQTATQEIFKAVTAQVHRARPDRPARQGVERHQRGAAREAHALRRAR